MKNLVHDAIIAFILGFIIGFCILIYDAKAKEPDYNQILSSTGKALYIQTGTKDSVEMIYKACPRYIQVSTTIIASGYQIFSKKQFQYKYRLSDKYNSRINLSKDNAFLSLEYSL